MNPEKISALVRHGAIKPEHVSLMVSHLNNWDPDKEEDSKAYEKKTVAYGSALRDLSKGSSDQHVLSRIGNLDPHSESLYTNKINSNIAGNENTPSDVLHSLAKRDDHYFGTITKNPNLSPEHAHDLITSLPDVTDARKIHWLASRGNLKPESNDHLLSMMKDSSLYHQAHSYVLGRMAQQPNLSAEHQNKIYDKAKELTKTTSFSGFDAIGHLAAHPKLDHGLAKRIATDFKGDDDMEHILSNNRDLPPGFMK